MGICYSAIMVELVMLNVNEQDLALGAVYAHALWDAAADQNQTDTVLAEALDLAAYLERHPESSLFFASPTVDSGAKRALIEKMFRGQYCDVLVDALQVINRNGRLGQFTAVAESYRRLHQDRSGRVEVFVRSAHPLTEAHRTRLCEVTARRTGREVDLIESRDESLLGGMVVRIDDDRFDMSVSRRLALMYQALLDRASSEIHSGRVYVERTTT